MNHRYSLWSSLGFVLVSASPAGPCQSSDQRDAGDWKQTLARLEWVAYSPSAADPTQGKEATKETIQSDLAALRRAKFNGLVTYSAAGVLGTELPDLARAAGFEALVVGVWNPLDKAEMAAAQRAGKSPIVLGFCVGNEGLNSGPSARYDLDALTAAVRALRADSGKPVTTSEEIEDYAEPALLLLGDWVFPNAHPYFHDRVEPEAAVRWTQGAYEDLARKTDKPLVFKEVGLPTAGGAADVLSESKQAQYYADLSRTPVRFVYFEAFDQPWKTHLAIEPHWGLFHADRTPKLWARRRMGLDAPVGASAVAPLHVFVEADSPDNHFEPTGLMGDCGDVRVDQACTSNPHSGTTCIKLTYDAKGQGPHSCKYSPPCRWAGVYWQFPANNWGTEERLRGKGLNLSAYSRVLFWARADKAAKIQFKVGGIDERYGDSLKNPRTITASLSDAWQEFSIDLRDADLSHIIGGFCCVSTKDATPEGVNVYLDDVRYE